MTQNIIESMKVKGFTYLGEVDGEAIFCNLESEESICNTVTFLEKLTGETWCTFKEEFGNENTVFYRKNMYTCKNSHLLFVGSNKVELPLNCSSCYKMFTDCEFNNDLDFSHFDSSRVIEMDRAFSNSRFSEDIDFSWLNTSNVVDFYTMFNGATFNGNVNINFDTSKATNMCGMFMHSCFCGDLIIGDNFVTDSVQAIGTVVDMFRYSRFKKGAKFGNGFCITSTADLFSHARLPGGLTRADFNSDKDIIEWLKSGAALKVDNAEKLEAF